jgi:hypothetical protein
LRKRWVSGTYQTWRLLKAKRRWLTRGAWILLLAKDSLQASFRAGALEEPLLPHLRALLLGQLAKQALVKLERLHPVADERARPSHTGKAGLDPTTDGPGELIDPREIFRLTRPRRKGEARWGHHDEL